MQIELRPLSEIKPYPGNPRQNDDAAFSDFSNNCHNVDAPEIWVPIPNYEGSYEVSSFGRVRRSSRTNNVPAGYILKECTTWDGYIKYALSKRQKYWYVKAHRLVAIAFLGPPPFPRAHVAHTDGNKRNNHISNLRWATPAENEADKRRHGRVRGAPPGERHPFAKLTAEQVGLLRDMVATGKGVPEVAKQLNMSKQTAYDAAFGITWRTVTCPAPLTRRRSFKK
jgi:hypothetical protein